MHDLADDAEIGRKKISHHVRFAVMDGLRGFAALIVVLYHSSSGNFIVPNGPLAVDLFFILSGFVIANAYEDRLSSGYGIGEFIGRRFARLYPMLFLGAAGGLILAFIHNKLNVDAPYPIGSVLMSGLLSLLVLPYISNYAINDSAFNFNPPIWSLFYEIVANLIYAFASRRLSVRVLMLIVVLGLAGVAWFGPLGGSSRNLFLAGFPRVACGFFGGVLLFRLWKKYPDWHGTAGITVLSIVMAAIFCLPIKIGGALFIPTYAALCGVVWFSAGNGAEKENRVVAFLGLVSYPVYLIHWLTMYVFDFIGKAVHLSGDRHPVIVVAHLLAVPFIAYFVSRWYEQPAHLFLERCLRRIGRH